MVKQRWMRGASVAARGRLEEIHQHESEGESLDRLNAAGPERLSASPRRPIHVLAPRALAIIAVGGLWETEALA
jgi:hypothetical protein